jgi:ATP-dependent protease HslVU (ClpYQ) peptidase subunit
MTTIATDGTSMAADGLVLAGGTITDTAFVKITKLSDGRIVGCSGSGYSSVAFRKWLEEGGDKTNKPDLTNNFSALVLHPDGSVLSYDEKCLSMPEHCVAAIGSGMDFALAAIDCGKGAYEAVRIAAGRDSSTGGTILLLER